MTSAVNGPAPISKHDDVASSPRKEGNPTMPDLADALTRGRQALRILEAPPADLQEGYTPDELAGQYAAIDRLVAAFREVDAAIGQPQLKSFPAPNGLISGDCL
ncbi:hypothetical protein SUAREZ_90 [Mycobacterium phage Suarez]|nr:hypothetical protein SUAREZ_90 [Mycobacterium phage Suarez]